MKKVSFAILMVLGLTAATAFAKTDNLAVSTKGDQLMFDKTELNAKAGDTIKLTFTNKAAKNSGLTHNWVLTKPGQDQAVATASMSAGADKGWIAESPDIIAHSKLTNPGEKDVVTFKAPEKGDYPYLCTFPGHSATMKGTLHVK